MSSSSRKQPKKKSKGEGEDEKRERDSKRPGGRQLGSSTEMPKQPTERTEVMAPFLSLYVEAPLLTLNGFSLSLYTSFLFFFPTDRPVSSPSLFPLSLSLSYSTRDIPPAIKVQRSGNSAHTRIYTTTPGGLYAAVERLWNKEDSLAFVPSDTAGPRPLSRTFFSPVSIV